ncbi:ATP-binding protein [Rugamonas sp.]|uniref:ATP-binding protein n=1 Tax=Rugamonas sp. TaxID=1926287 RepID=UPI0025E1CEA5|nr:ATP-binding protein [Rugamonas sp.]
MVFSARASTTTAATTPGAAPAATTAMPAGDDGAPWPAFLPASLPIYLPAYLLVFGLLSVLATLAARSFLADWQLVNVSLHTVAEASGALAALLLAFTIAVSPERDPKLHPYIVASALVAMSLLDLAHAAVPVGALSVWLRSMATLLGGLLFALTWLPPRPLARHQRRAALAAAIALALLCALPMGFAGTLPPMLAGGEFTPLAKAINVAGGLCFLAACLRYCLLYRRQRQTGYLLNANFCFLFGFSGLLLPYSQIWGLAWWYWHVLRLAGYLLILTHILLYIRRTSAALLQLNAELGESVRTLTKASERLRLATTAGGIGIWDWDVASNELLWDAQLYRLYGVAPDRFEASIPAWLARVTPDDRAATAAAFDAALRGEREYAVEFRIDWPDGGQRHIAAAGQTYFGADGRATRMVGVNQDVSAHRAAEQELRRHRDHLEEAVAERTRAWQSAAAEALAASRAKSLFLSNMSHELRTPMNAIIGFSTLMQRAPDLSDGQRQDLAIISRSGEHLLTLINDVLDMAKIEAGRVSVEQRPYDLHALTREVMEMVGGRAAAKGLTLRLEQAAPLPRHLCGDEGKLRQVLINLLGNAVKFTARGGVVLRLAAGGTAAAPLLLIDVEDSGQGIAEADQPAIFEPFVQVPGAAPQEGTGLGLTITRQFARLMGGTIDLASAPGQGSVFRLRLPLVAVDAADVAATPARPRVLRLAPGQPAWRVLVVEDQAENALLIERLLDGAGFVVEVARDGEDGVEAFARWRPHFIWMDRRMPRVDGIEACRRIRALPGGAQVKIVGLTASIMPEERGELLRAGMDDIVSKPYREDAIFSCMARLLGLSYLYQEQPAAGAGNAAEAQAALARLAALPLALRGALRQALFDLDDVALAALAAHIGRDDAALGAALAQHVAQSNHSAVLQALDLESKGNGR